MKRALKSLAAVVAFSAVALAGGPLVVTGPTNTQQGQPFVWGAGAVSYHVDRGPMSTTPTGTVVITNSAGLTRVNGMFQTWQSVPTATISYTYGGPITATGLSSDGDVNTVAEFNAVGDTCDAGTQNSVIFDADGSLVLALTGEPLIIGFAGPCAVTSDGHIRSGWALMNGSFQDGISNYTTQNYELTAEQFDEALTHEFGHFSGLDHSQINVDVFGQPVDGCAPDTLAGLPLMFPIAYCQDRASAGFPKLAPDDQAWISHLYPSSSYTSTYGTISGYVYFSDGRTQAQGVNVVARAVDDPNTAQDESKRVAFSAVSGLFFTGSPGQTLTTTNSTSPFGSRNPAVIGYYEIPVLPGTYTVQVENIDGDFSGGSSVGPLPFPIPVVIEPEFWNQYESASDFPDDRDTITVSAGQIITNVNIILNGTEPRFDQFEDGGADLREPVQFFSLPWLREEEMGL